MIKNPGSIAGVFYWFLSIFAFCTGGFVYCSAWHPGYIGTKSN